jgi:hypothetical protein
MGSIVRSAEEVLEQVQLAIRSGNQLAAIDGVPGAGKSHLAKQVHDVLGLQGWLDFDDFLVRQQGHYFNALRLEDLKEAMRTTKPKVVSGACMRLVLEALGITNVCHIYVKRVCLWGWAEEFETTQNGLEDFERESGLTDERSAFRREIRDYHLQYTPHHCADLVYERFDSGR